MRKYTRCGRGRVPLVRGRSASWTRLLRRYTRRGSSVRTKGITRKRERAAERSGGRWGSVRKELVRPHTLVLRPPGSSLQFRGGGNPNQDTRVLSLFLFPSSPPTPSFSLFHPGYSFRRGSQRRHAPLREERSLMLHSAG